MSLAPIVCFVYNRPEHTRRTLLALSRCTDADKSIVYIYSDGVRRPEDRQESEHVKAVREIIRNFNGFEKIIVRENETNSGLQESIIRGVTEVVNKHGRVIVLEDDILCGTHFLTYCNAALEHYQHQDRVMHINGYLFNHREKFPEVFFSSYAFVWGWATWKRAWDKFSPDAHAHLEQLNAEKTGQAFDQQGAAGTLDMLRRQAEGRLRTWDVLWYASVFNEKGLCLTPGKSLTKNIGLDGSGEHYRFKVKRPQYRTINWPTAGIVFPDVSAYTPENENMIRMVLERWNQPRLIDRIAGKLKLIWKNTGIGLKNQR